MKRYDYAPCPVCDGVFRTDSVHSHEAPAQDATPRLSRIRKGTILPPEGGWKPQTYYWVEMAVSPDNVIWKAIFYTGFLNGAQRGEPGGYHGVVAPISDGQFRIRLDQVHYLRALAEIPGPP